jgi:hypothetical protein
LKSWVQRLTGEGGDISGRMKMKYLKHQTGEGVTQVQTPCLLDNGQGYDRRLGSSYSAIIVRCWSILSTTEGSVLVYLTMLLHTYLLTYLLMELSAS